MRKRLLLVGLLLLVLVSVVSAQETQVEETVVADDVSVEWWDETVWYLLFVRSFYDSDGDGIGDLQGITEKLDYLNDGDPTTTDDLGITGIWLMPITDAASYHGYDTIDYRAIDPDYGTIEDLEVLLDAAHERGIRVIMDLVMNHTSSQHPWFIQSAAGDAEYADWYIWRDENPGYLGPWGANAWYALNGRWYYAPFWSEMPDLNYDNPDVLAEMFDVATMWVEDIGVDGYRLDAVRYLLEDEVDGRPVLADAPINRALLTDLNETIKETNPEAVTIGEIWTSSNAVRRYVDEGSVDMAFEFDLADAIVSSASAGNQRNIYNRMRSILPTYEYGQWASFTTNHDQARLLSQLNGNIEANKMAASMLLLGQGAPFIYYGEEIGMQGNKPDELIRTPMQWDETVETGGFTQGTPWEPLTANFEQATVAGETDDPDSLLSHYRALVHLRNETPALSIGQTALVESNYRSVYSFVRYTADETVLVILNLDNEETRDFSLTLEEGPLSELTSAEVLFGDMEPALPEMNEAGGFSEYVPFDEPMPPYTTMVIRLN